MNAMLLVRGVFIALFSVVASPPVLAQIYPTKPVRLVVGNQVGSGMDVTARTIAGQLSENLGVQVVVDNRPGAASVIAAELVANAAPDGYTILLVNPSHATSHYLVERLPYDALKDFDPVTQLAISANILVANPALPADSVSQLIALAKSRPGEVTVGGLPRGSFSNLCAVLFGAMAGTRLSEVSYRGGPAAVTDLIAGRIALVFTGVPSVLPHLKSARLKGIAVTTMTRSLAVPEVPTIHESGLPGYNAALWYGIVAPANTPPRFSNKLHAEIAKAVSAPHVRNALLSRGLEPKVSGPAAFGAYIKAEMDKWGKVLRTAK